MITDSGVKDSGFALLKYFFFLNWKIGNNKWQLLLV